MQSRKNFGPNGLIIHSCLYISGVKLKLALWNHSGDMFKVIEKPFSLNTKEDISQESKTMLKFGFVLCFDFFFFKATELFL